MITESQPIKRWNYNYPKKDTHKVQPIQNEKKADNKKLKRKKKVS